MLLLNEPSLKYFMRQSGLSQMQTEEGEKKEDEESDDEEGLFCFTQSSLHPAHVTRVSEIDISQVESFEAKSNVNVRARDNQGWSVLHHLVSPLAFGTYDSVRMLRILYDAGSRALLKMQDGAGLTALDYSLIKGAPKLSQAIQQLKGIEEEHRVRVC